MAERARLAAQRRRRQCRRRLAGSPGGVPVGAAARRGADAGAGGRRCRRGGAASWPASSASTTCGRRTCARCKSACRHGDRRPRAVRTLERWAAGRSGGPRSGGHAARQPLLRDSRGDLRRARAAPRPPRRPLRLKYFAEPARFVSATDSARVALLPRGDTGRAAARAPPRPRPPRHDAAAGLLRRRGASSGGRAPLALRRQASGRALGQARDGRRADHAVQHRRVRPAGPLGAPSPRIHRRARGPATAATLRDATWLAAPAARSGDGQAAPSAASSGRSNWPGTCTATGAVHQASLRGRQRLVVARQRG